MDKNSNLQLELFSKDGAVFKTRSQLRASALIKFLRSYEKKALLTVGILIISIISFSLGVEKGRRMLLTEIPANQNTNLGESSKEQQPKPQATRQWFGLQQPKPQATRQWFGLLLPKPQQNSIKKVTAQRSEVAVLRGAAATEQSKESASRRASLTAKGPFARNDTKKFPRAELLPVSVLNPSYTIQLASYKGKTYAEKAAQALKKKGLVSIILTKGNYTVLCAGSFADKKSAQMNLAEFKKTYRDCYIREINPNKGRL